MNHIRHQPLEGPPPLLERSVSDAGHYAGKLHVLLTVRTPMTAPTTRSADRDARALASSSLKGMLRKAAAAAWNGQLTVADPAWTERVDPRWLSFVSASEQQHCAVTHLFGMVKVMPNGGRTQAVASKVRLTAAQAVRIDARFAAWREAADSSAGERAAADSRPSRRWYDGSGYDGRMIRLLPNEGGWTPDDAAADWASCAERIERSGALAVSGESLEYLVMPGSTYRFELFCRSIREDDLAELIRLIELPEGRHRLGRGKAYGFGQVTMAVTDIVPFDTAYYLSPGWGPAEGRPGEKERLLAAHPARYPSEPGPGEGAAR